jgi:predicted glycosyl hydrolase (DUF1957 family)
MPWKLILLHQNRYLRLNYLALLMSFLKLKRKKVMINLFMSISSVILMMMSAG